MKQTTSGSQANYTGTALQRFIEERLVERGYAYIDRKQFQPSTYLHQPTYTREFCVGEGLYGKDFRCDFILYHPQKHTACLVIEAKWQQTGGSVDEKYPFLILNIKDKYPYETILILDGGGYKQGAREWIGNQVGGNFKTLFDMAGFQKWANSDNL